jgi:hydroxypyruvate reductase
VLAAALRAADAGEAVRRVVSRERDTLDVAGQTVPLGGTGALYLVAAGKAARAMVEAFEGIAGDGVAATVGATVPSGAGATRRGHLHAAGHPLPDPGSLMGARHVASLLERAGADDTVVVLISGGASALLEMPVRGLQLADLVSATSALLASGATINEMNAVRKHLSRIKGGQLARLAAPARCITLAVSDVVGNALDVIGSGPTVPDSTAFGDAAQVISRYGLWERFPAAAADAIRRGAAGSLPETPKAGDTAFERATTVVIASNVEAAEAARVAASSLGYHAAVLTTWLEGEAREAGRLLAALGKEVASHGRPVGRPAVLVAGGETTVTLRTLGGHGGRNQELALGAAVALEGWRGVTIASLGTDGIDGSSDAAGAVVDGTTLRRAAAAGLDARALLDAHQSASLFSHLGDAIMTGPTGTNVNDLVVVLVEGAAGRNGDG